MRAAVLHELGTIPVFGDFREPEAGEGIEVAEVVVAGLNPIDLYIAAGRLGELELPCVVGLEGVARLGDRRVYFNGVPAPFGSMAQFVPLQPANVFTVPDRLAPSLAVALGIAGLAAWLALDWRAHVQPGETVLVLGATSVVGQIGVQAARLLGAGRIVAAGRDRPTLEALRARGADEIVVLEGDIEKALMDAAADGYDVILDVIYGPPLEAALAAASIGARSVSVGANAGMSATIPFRSLMGRTVIGHSNSHAPPEVRRAAYDRMARHAAAGELSVEVERLPLSRIEEAWRHQARGPHRKIVLVP